MVDAFTEAGLQDVAASPTNDGSKAVHGHAPGPVGTPTVLLYSHYDVQPPLGEDAWKSPVWELTERDGRWYGRGAADCKGNIVMHLTALRALKLLDGGPVLSLARNRGQADWRHSSPRTRTSSGPTRSSSSTPATSPSACPRSRRRCAA